jgi:hypothetical protein
MKYSRPSCHASHRGCLKKPRRSLFCIGLFLLLNSSIGISDRPPSSSLHSNALPPSTSTLSSTVKRHNETTAATSTIILTETEVFDGQSWQAVSWTDATTGDPAPSPGDYPSSAVGNWISDWKIVTGTLRDEFGWDYKTNRLRKRTWIRTYEILPDAHGSKHRRPTTALVHSSPATLSRRPTAPVLLSGWMQSVKDSYNFKGFGLTFYKSLVFRESFGLALRLPLTYNFNLWEQHPSLPTVGASLAVYHPWVICVFINTSLRMEVIQWAVTTSVATFVYVTCWMIWTVLLRGLLVAGSALLFPVTRRFYQPTFPLQQPNWHGPDYSRSVEERLGVSWSWRLSLARGYEYRFGCSHYLAHSLVALLKSWNIQRIPGWIVRRVAAIGTSVSGPIPDQPYMTASSLLSLSGLYFVKRNKGTSQKQPTLEVSVTSALEELMPSSDDDDDEEKEEDSTLTSKSELAASMASSH